MAPTDKAAELLAQLEAGVSDLVNGDDWARALEVASRFHTYSFRNVMLIAMQCPEATRVAGFKTWQSLGRQVRKGEHGIRILAPMIAKRTELDDAGEERTRSIVRGFRSVAVFDIGQTDGDELPEVRPQLLEGEAPAGGLEAIVAQIRAAGFSFEVGTVPAAGANGVTSFTSRAVIVSDELSPAQTLKTAIHELAHVLLHEAGVSCRGVAEVEAESTAFVVAGALGLETSSYSFGYVASWSDGKVETVSAVGDRVAKTAKQILAACELNEEVAA